MRGKASAGMVALLGLAVASGSCRRKDGESWAKEHLGAGPAGFVRKEASTVTGLAQSGELRTDPSFNKKETPYLPRPYVVLATSYSAKTDSSSLVFDELNLKLSQPIQTIADVKGIAVLDRSLVMIRHRGKNLGHAEYAVYLVDRADGTATVANLDSTDAMEAFLSSVPAEQP
jgi:hypothetical protein